MSSGRASGRMGFQRWYERQLFVSFAWLTSCILCGVLIGVLLEFVGLGGPGMVPIANAACIYVVGLAGVETWRRFRSTLSHAQTCANQATCKSCNGYGLFDVDPSADHMPARCRRCGHLWAIE